MLSSCVIVHTILYYGRTLLNAFKRIRIEKDDIHAKLMRSYPEVPNWWYGLVFVVFFCLMIVANEVSYFAMAVNVDSNAYSPPPPPRYGTPAYPYGVSYWLLRFPVSTPFLRDSFTQRRGSLCVTILYYSLIRRTHQVLVRLH